jgi:hypothetical protein
MAKPGHQLSVLRFSWFYSVPPGDFRDITLKLGHDRYLPNPFQFTYYPFIRRCRVLAIEKALLSKVQINLMSHNVHFLQAVGSAASPPVLRQN